MANIVITTTAKSIIVDFGIYATSNSVDGTKASYKRDDLSIPYIAKDGTHVIVKMKDFITTNNWKLSHNHVDNDCFVVDSIDGVAPTSVEDLFLKINALR
jgi:hypothetical protein